MNKIKGFFKRYQFTVCFLLAFGLNLIIEMFNRKSVISGFVFMFSSPLIFIYNSIIIACTFSIAFLFKKRVFVYGIFYVIWLILGIANFVVLTNRSTPLAAIDFAILRSSLDIIKVYVTSWQFFVYVFLVALGTFVLVLMYKKTPKYPLNLKKGFVIVFLYCGLCSILTLLFSRFGVIPDKFDNLPNAYKKYGFVFCFSDTVIDHGVDKPQDYSNDNTIKQINTLLELKDTNPKQKPNIVFVQLESFVDPNEFNFLSFSKNPVPNMTNLKKNNGSGKLIVPMIGAGTSNIEFEIMTGMSLKYFGAAEYPYKTILQEKCCESIAYNLKEHGYKTTAIHNHTGSFYDRNIVFANLGYDCYNSVEYIPTVTRNPIKWAEDKILTDEIMRALNKSKQQDFIYAISVQGHGKYPATEIEYQKHINVGTTKYTDQLTKYEYYVNQIHEMDMFVGELCNQIMDFDEPTVLVFFGDHLPALDLVNEDMATGSIYNSAYVIVSNFELPQSLKTDKDLYTYQLSAHIMKAFGFNNGIINKLHQLGFDHQTTQKYLEMLEYDMLYGINLCGELYRTYSPVDLQMGINKVVINGISENEEGTIIRGANFTKYSEVYVNNRHISEKMLSNEELFIKQKYLKDGDVLVIKQVAGDRTVLSATPEYNVSRQTESVFESRWEVG